MSITQNELRNNGKPAGLMAYIDDKSKQGIISAAVANGLKYSVKSAERHDGELDGAAAGRT